MSLSKHKNIPSSYDFPEEILSEVFKRLPVKYVLRCGAVKKSWYSLIKSPLFISLHSNYQKITAHINPKYLLFDNTSTNELIVRSDDPQCQEYCAFDYPHDLPVCSWSTESNGLLCMSNMLDFEHDYNPDIYLFNPLVQKFKTVPESPLSTVDIEEIRWDALAFGFLPELNDYVVVHIVKLSSTSEPLSFDPNSHLDYEQYPHSVIIGIYSLNTNSWKEIRQDKVFIDSTCTDQSVFVNGTAYWIGCDDSDQIVMYFDTKTNLLRKIEVTGSIVLNSENPLILPFGQSIAYFVEDNENDLEVEDDDEEEEEEEEEEDYWSFKLHIWVLKYKVIGKDDLIGEFCWEMSVSLHENVWAEVLGTRNNGDLIQAKSNSLIAYDLDTHEPYDFVESCDHLKPSSYGFKSSFRIRPFVETLVLLDID